MLHDPRVTFLLECRYPKNIEYQCLDKEAPHYLPRKRFYQIDAEMNAYERMLGHLDEDFLEEFYGRELKELRPKLAEREHAELLFYRLEDDDAAPDFDFWLKTEVWSLEEAVALALGKSPKRLDERIATSRKKRLELARDFLTLLDLAERAVTAQARNPQSPTAASMTDPVPPADFVIWVQQHRDQCAEPFLKATDSLSATSREDLVAKIKILEFKIVELKSKRASGQSMKKIILNRAIKDSAYHKNPSHNDAASKISKSQHAALSVEPNTVREILSSAWADFGSAFMKEDKTK